MNVSTIKELAKLIDLCRKKGIEEIEVDNLKFKLGPVKEKFKDSSSNIIESDQMLSPDDVLNWSVSSFEGVG